MFLYQKMKIQIGRGALKLHITDQLKFPNVFLSINRAIHAE